LRIRLEGRRRVRLIVGLVVRLLRGDDRADRALGFGTLGVLDVVDVERHRDRGEDRHDHDHHHQLHQGEALLIPPHAISPFGSWLSYRELPGPPGPEHTTRMTPAPRRSVRRHAGSRDFPASAPAGRTAWPGR